MCAYDLILRIRWPNIHVCAIYMIFENDLPTSILHAD